MRNLLIICLCCLLTSCAVEEPAPYQRPADIKSFFNRAEQCQHWAGEEAYDAARGKEILQAVHRLRCEQLDEEYDRLHRKYAADKAALADLETTNRKNGFDFLYPHH